MANCKKRLVYEAEACGLLYLTLDNYDPVYIGFQHRAKLEVCLVQELDKTRTSGSHPGEVTREAGHVNKEKETVHWRTVDKVPAVSGLSEPNLKSTVIEPVETLTVTKTLHGESVRVLDSSATKDIFNPPTFHALAEDGHAVAEGIEILDSTKCAPREESWTREKSENDLEIKHTKKLQGKRETRRKSLRQRLSRVPNRLKQNKDQSSKLMSSTLNARVSVSEHIIPEEQNREKGLTQVYQKKAETIVKCDYCCMTFTSKREFFKHRKLKSEKLYRCEICAKPFPYRGYFLVHMKIHSEEPGKMNHVCSECGQSSKNYTELKKHMISHTGEHIYKCCQCPKTFPHFHNLRSHMSVHKAPGLIKCSCCNQFFPTRAALSEHKMALQEIVCGLCGQVFPNKASRIIHYKTEHEDKILRCHTCKRMYSTQKELEEHMAKHGRRSRKQCPVCGRMVTNLRNHMVTHKPIEEMTETELWMCDKCPSKFRTNATLMNHMKTNHSEQRSKCHLCLQSFKSYKGLYRHLNNVHSNLMPYQCEVCGKRCKLKSNLKIHMRVHSNTKMFPCQLCSQAFNYKSSLEGHMRSKHSSDTSSTALMSSALDSYTPTTTTAVSSISTSSMPSWGGSVERTDGTAPVFRQPASDPGSLQIHRYYGSVPQPQL